jgi:uncharacterized membrane protein
MGTNATMSPSHLRQILDRVAHRLLFVPIVFVVASVVLTQAMLWIDAGLGDEAIPRVLETTVEGGRATLSTIAGGLIASITLLLSLTLVAVQLGNTQFSPRTLRDWIGNRTQQVTIGVALGTTVYCLLALRRTRAFDEGDLAPPHLTVLLSVALGVLTLILVVRSVDHLADSLRVGSLAGRLTRETIALVEAEFEMPDRPSPAAAPAAPGGLPHRLDRPSAAAAIEADRSGWVQQVDESAVVEAVPDGHTIELTTALGAYVAAGTPLAWVWSDRDGHEGRPEVEDSEAMASGVRGAVAVGDTRTMQQDVGFGILQLVDIALRALSPGVNDPATANDVIAHLGEVMLAIWDRPAAERRRTIDGRTLITAQLDHAGHLASAFDQIRRYGAADVEVATTLVRTLLLIRSEALRRRMCGPTEPIEDMLALVVAGVEASDALGADKEKVRLLLDVTD